MPKLDFNKVALQEHKEGCFLVLGSEKSLTKEQKIQNLSVRELGYLSDHKRILL